MLAAINFLADLGGTFWQAPSASTVAPEIDALFDGILWTCVFFTLLITVLLVVFAVKYRHREGFHPGPAPAHNNALELTWTFIPVVIVTIIFVYGFQGFMRLAVVPPDAYEIQVRAHMWGYSFYYPNQYQDPDLHIPKGTPIAFILDSSDVIHGFYIPAFRIKKDIVPGRYNRIWVDATQVGTYDIYCTQYCGEGHSGMRAHVIVQEPADYAIWLAKASVLTGTPDQIGAILYERRGCNACHSIDGTILRAPSWKNLAGYEQPLQDGTHPVVTDEFLHDVIAHPNSKPVPGFGPIMPPTIDAGLIKEEEVPDLIAYINTLSDKGHKPATLPSTAPTTVPASQP